MWTQFMDMHSGGGQKLDWSYIYIEAPEKEARAIFYNRFGRNPERVTCTCCGDDYSITESETLQEASAYERGCAFVYRRPDGTICDRSEGFVPGKGQTPGYTSGYEEMPETDRRYQRKHWTLDEYREKDGILIIEASDIKDEERQADIPDEGYVWAGG